MGTLPGLGEPCISPAPPEDAPLLQGSTAAQGLCRASWSFSDRGPRQCRRWHKAVYLNV